MKRWVVAVVLAASAAGSAAEKDKPADTSAAILQQLVEMQKEMKALRDEMAQLRQAVADLGRARGPAAPPLPAAVSLDGAAQGSATAPVAIVEFSEFQCPFCRRFHDQTLAQIKQQYVDTGKVRYVFRHLPLPMHPQARPAAVASHCAGKQDAFWAMHDGLFANQPRLGPPLYEEIATGLKLDLGAFQACLKDPEAEKVVAGDAAYANSIGVTGTPTFFVGKLKDGRLVNPQRISGAQPLPAFAAAIEAALK